RRTGGGREVVWLAKRLRKPRGGYRALAHGICCRGNRKFSSPIRYHFSRMRDWGGGVGVDRRTGRAGCLALWPHAIDCHRSRRSLKLKRQLLNPGFKPKVGLSEPFR